jgi:hypothetical protein
LTYSDITIDTRQALRGAGSEIIWEDWLFEESRRRLDSYLLYYNGQSVWLLTKSKIVRSIPGCEHAYIFRASKIMQFAKRPYFGTTAGEETSVGSGR